MKRTALLRRRRNTRIRANALKAAKSQVGVKESPPNSNRGPMVDEFLAASGLRGQAEPWCAAFVTWCYKQAGYELHGYNTAYCPAWLQRCRTSPEIVQVLPKNVRPGDVVLFDWQRDAIADHIGFVTSRVKHGEFQTVEGNTSTGSSGDQSNGGCVAARTRNVRDVIAFLRVVPR